jgi:hypothetical protein
MTGRATALWNDRCYPFFTTFHRLGEMGARRPFLV